MSANFCPIIAAAPTYLQLCTLESRNLLYLKCNVLSDYTDRVFGLFAVPAQLQTAQCRRHCLCLLLNQHNGTSLRVGINCVCSHCAKQSGAVQERNGKTLNTHTVTDKANGKTNKKTPQKSTQENQEQQEPYVLVPLGVEASLSSLAAVFLCLHVSLWTF